MAANITQDDLSAATLLDKDIELYPMMKTGEIDEAFKKLRAGDESYIEKIFLANMRLVRKVVNEKANRYDPVYMDMFQDGFLGLRHAIDKYDHESGFKFSTYANYWIRHYIDRGRKKDLAIHIPDYLQAEKKSYNNFKKDFYMKNGRLPSLDEAAAGMGYDRAKKGNKSIDRVITLENLAVAKGSIDKSPDETNGDTSYLEILPSDSDTPDEIYVQNETCDEVNALIAKTLKPREMAIVKLRYGLGFTGCISDRFISVPYGTSLTLEELSHLMSLTRERIRQIEMNSIKKMQKSADLKYLRGYAC